MTQPPLDVAPGFPDLFVFALQNQLQIALSEAPTYPVATVLTRPLRPNDPTLSVAVFEGDAEPVEYEIGGFGSGLNGQPSLLRWTSAIQVLVKSAEEQEGRAIRAKLLTRIRQTLFSSTTLQAIMTLNDPVTKERLTKFRFRRFAYANGDLPEGNALFFIGQAEVYYDTEFH